MPTGVAEVAGFEQAGSHHLAGALPAYDRVGAVQQRQVSDHLPKVESSVKPELSGTNAWRVHCLVHKAVYGEH